MDRYDLATEWVVCAPLAVVWDHIYHSTDWPRWWHGLVSVVELERGNDEGIGNRRRYVWRGRLPYRLIFDITVTRIDTHSLLEGHASGDVSGTGRWRFFPERGGSVRVRHDWRVVLEKTWMRRWAPLAHPIFKWNHDVVMRRGAQGLERQLERPVTCRAVAGA